MKLHKWVDYYGGLERLASKLNMKERTIKAWLDGQNTPSIFDTQALVRLSRGNLDYDSLIKELKKLRGRPLRKNRAKARPVIESSQQVEATENAQDAE